MTELRIRTRLRKEDLEPKVGKVLGPRDYDLLLTGQARVLKPDGRPLCVYLPRALAGHAQNKDIYDVLHGLRTIRTDNRGNASGTTRLPSPQNPAGYAKRTPSAVIGALDPTSRWHHCRLTAWTGQHLPQWRTLEPLLRGVAHHLATHVPDRYRNQLAHASATHPDWVIPGTPFTTVTVNNTYPTGTHTDKGDLDSGFSTITVLRRGTYTGGHLVFPEYRVAVDLHDGDLILMDAHDWHANTAITCRCGNRLFGACDICGAERISVVSYYRTKMAQCGSNLEETTRAKEVSRGSAA